MIPQLLSSVLPSGFFSFLPFPAKSKKDLAIFFLWGLAFFFLLDHDILSDDKKDPSPDTAKTSLEEGLSSLPAVLKKEDRYFSILFAGDTHFNWGVADLQKKEGLLAPVQNIRPLFAETDFRILNLESVLGNKGYPLRGKSYIFHSLSKNISVLKHLDINLAILGNNHSMDMGLPGLMDMRRLLREAGIGAIGAGRNIEEALKAYHFKEKGEKKTETLNFSVLSLSQVGYPEIFSSLQRPGVAKGLKKNTLSKLTKKAKLILSLHWGREYFLQPSIEQVKFAHRAIQKGASALIGHHPHIPQAVELYKGGVIFYSLGNFLFGSRNGLQRENIIAILDYNKAKGNLERVRIVPIQGRYRERGHKVRLLNEEESRDFWKNYYILIKRHSRETARRLSIKEGIGILYL